MIDVEARQEAEVEEEMTRRVRALADLDLNSGEIPMQSQQGDINASNSPFGYSVAPKSKGNVQVSRPESPTLNLLGGLAGRREVKEQVSRTVNQGEKSNEFMKSIAKGLRLEFPVFEGDNPLGWIRQCDKYFELARVPEEN